MPTPADVLRAALASVLLLGCTPAAPPPAPAAPAPVQAPAQVPAQAEGAAQTPPPPAAPPPALAPPPGPPAPVDVVEAQAILPGAVTPLKNGEQTTVDPAASFRLVLKGTYREARLSLLDAADAMQSATGGREVGPTTTVTLTPAPPLKPGTTYRLRVDGAATRELRAGDGALRGPVEFTILTAGEPPAEPKAKAKKPKKRP